MQKILKTLLITIISVAAICFACFAAGCGDKGNNTSSTYSVKVIYENGDAVNGWTDGKGGVDAVTDESLTYIYAQWCGVSTTQCADPVQLSTEGKASISASVLKEKLGDAPYHLQLNGVLDTYTYDEVTVTGPGEVTIILHPVSSAS
jgi:hypothetical protein